MKYLGIGGFPSGLILLMFVEFKDPIPMIIWTCFAGLCLLFGRD